MRNGPYPCCVHCNARPGESGSHANPCGVYQCPGDREATP